MSLLRVNDLRVCFGRSRTEVVHGIDFTVERGQRLGLIGESGCGKSVTALACLGLLPETARASGSIVFNETQMLGTSDSVLSRLRGDQLSMVFQEPMTALDPTMRVGRQVGECVDLHRAHRDGTTRRRVLEMLDAVGLPDPPRISRSYPHQLSGGQRQRVVLAMALINKPDLVICDEPTTALDVTVQARVLQVLNACLDDVGAACLFISHDLAVVSQVCSQVMVMLDGNIIEGGTIDEVFGAPRHPYTKGLLATARLDGVRPGERLPTVADFGEVRP